MLKDYNPIYEPTKLIRVTYQHICPICFKKNWCSFAENGSYAICMRISAGSVKGTKNGGYVHILGSSDYIKPEFVAPPPVIYKAKPLHIHNVYSFLLDQLYLQPDHLKNLIQDRGLNKKTVTQLGYKSMPTKIELFKLMYAIREKFGNALRGVPGFFTELIKNGNRSDNVWQMVRYDGILLPARNTDGSILGMQIRKDEGDPRYVWFSSNPDKLDNGTSSGVPVHFSNPNKNSVLYLTEGVLKADVVSYFTGAPVIGVAGVSTVRPEKLRDEISKIRTPRSKVIMVYDSDWRTNEFVTKAMIRTGEILAKKFDVKIRTWSGSKGYDDLLFTNESPITQDLNVQDFKYLSANI